MAAAAPLPAAAATALAPSDPLPLLSLPGTFAFGAPGFQAFAACSSSVDGAAGLSIGTGEPCPGSNGGGGSGAALSEPLDSFLGIALPQFLRGEEFEF